MQYSIRESKVLVDSECKRYFSFDGVVVGVLYLIHKYMPDYYLKQSYNEMYLEYSKQNICKDFTKDLKEDLFSASNNLLKVDKLIDVEMNALNGRKQRALIDIEIQNKYQSDYWKRACNYLCRIRSEYFHYLRVRYPNQWVPIISCWFMTNRSKKECPFVEYTPYSYESKKQRYLSLASISFQYSEQPPKTDDEIEMAFYKLLSPHSKEEERMQGAKTLHCDITEEEVKKMCNYSEVCIMFGEAKGEERGIKIGEERGIKIGEEKGRTKERKSTIKLLLNKMNVDEVANIFQGTITKEEIMEIQQEVKGYEC